MNYSRSDFEKKYNQWVECINDALAGIIIEKDTPEKNIYKAMRYSLMAGGKRIRPVLSLAVSEMLGGKVDEILPYACAIELIHTYSLIHDDLPAMDNDDYRRGKPTNHKVFGEAMAILAGDGLLTFAFELMTNALIEDAGKINEKYGLEAAGRLSARIKAINYIARAAGVSGMVGGQVVDMESENRVIDKQLLEYMHRCKTGALIKASVIVPALILEAGEKDVECLEMYAESIGLAFQIKDDIFDVEGNAALLGKQTGRDITRNKATYVSLYGIEEARSMLDDLIEKGISALDRFKDKAAFLRSLAYYIKEREN